MTIVNKKIQEKQKKDLPINYSTTSVDKMGNLSTRKASLEDRVIEGYAVIWGSKNDYNEVFVKGCFSKSISDYGPNSSAAYQIKFRDRHGKSCSLFAELKEDDIGLYFKTKSLDNVQWATDLITQIRSGTVNNFSIGFKHCWDKVEWDDKTDTMINLEARLFEISAVDIPSDMETYAMRSQEEIEYLVDDVEDFVTSLPKSKHLEARKILTRCMSLVNSKQPEEMRQALKESKQADAVDYNYLINNLKF